MRKVLVIGSCGSGKSVFSRRLGELTRLPVIHLDSHFWQPGWVETEKSAWKDRVTSLLAGEAWIIDGNYSGTMDLRLESCDTVIFLDLPRHICTWRVIKRVIQNYGRTREDLAPDCPEKFDLSFIKWTWNYRTRSRPAVIKRLERVQDRVSITWLSNARQVKDYLKTLESKLSNNGQR